MTRSESAGLTFAYHARTSSGLETRVGRSGCLNLIIRAISEIRGQILFLPPMTRISRMAEAQPHGG